MERWGRGEDVGMRVEDVRDGEMGRRDGGRGCEGWERRCRDGDGGEDVRDGDG